MKTNVISLLLSMEDKLVWKVTTPELYQRYKGKFEQQKNNF